jgi:hypothetical protein
MDQLNSEEKISLEEVCFDYQDVFFLPGTSKMYVPRNMPLTSNQGPSRYIQVHINYQGVEGKKLIGSLKTYWKGL